MVEDEGWPRERLRLLAANIFLLEINRCASWSFRIPFRESRFTFCKIKARPHEAEGAPSAKSRSLRPNPDCRVGNQHYHSGKHDPSCIKKIRLLGPNLGGTGWDPHSILMEKHTSLVRPSTLQREGERKSGGCQEGEGARTGKGRKERQRIKVRGQGKGGGDPPHHAPKCDSSPRALRKTPTVGLEPTTTRLRALRSAD